MKCRGFPGDISSKEPACQHSRHRHRFDLWDPEDPLEEEIATHSNILAWRSHGQRNLVGYSPWGCKRVRHSLTNNNNIYIHIHVIYMHTCMISCFSYMYVCIQITYIWIYLLLVFS